MFKAKMSVFQSREYPVGAFPVVFIDETKETVEVYRSDIRVAAGSSGRVKQPEPIRMRVHAQCPTNRSSPLSTERD